MPLLRKGQFSAIFKAWNGHFWKLAKRVPTSGPVQEKIVAHHYFQGRAEDFFLGGDRRGGRPARNLSPSGRGCQGQEIFWFLTSLNVFSNHFLTLFVVIQAIYV